MHLPTLRQLEFLCAVADHGSFSKAAEACHVTQPTLSAAIKEVEGLLGVQLIERESRGASMTPCGVSARQTPPSRCSSVTGEFSWIRTRFDASPAATPRTYIAGWIIAAPGVFSPPR